MGTSPTAWSKTLILVVQKYPFAGFERVEIVQVAIHSGLYPPSGATGLYLGEILRKNQAGTQIANAGFSERILKQVVTGMINQKTSKKKITEAPPQPLAPKAALGHSIILGIDPGTVVMGFSVISCQGQHIQLLTMDVLKMSYTHDVFERLERIYQTIDKLIIEFNPTQFAIEAPFFGKNVQSMLKLGRAQGVAIACAIKHGLPVTEYSPKKVKQSITGNGNADKERVWGMLERLLSLNGKPAYFDASDALSVAVCHHFQMSSPLGALANGSKKGWDQFIKNNPGRVKP